MSIREMGAVLRRRWYVIVPAILLSLLAALHLYRSVPVAYQSQSSVALLDSSAAAKLPPAFGNPISNAGGALVVTADVLIRTLSGADAARELHSLGVTDPYTVGFAANTSGPLLTLTVTGTDREKVLEETNLLTGFAGEQLNALQAAAKVQPAYMVQTAPVVLPQTPVPQLKSRYQQVLGVLILGVGGGFVLSFVADALLAARRRRRERATEAAGTPDRAARRRSRGRHVDATALLTGYLALAFFIPSNLTLPGLAGWGPRPTCSPCWPCSGIWRPARRPDQAGGRDPAATGGDVAAGRVGAGLVHRERGPRERAQGAARCGPRPDRPAGVGVAGGAGLRRDPGPRAPGRPDAPGRGDGDDRGGRRVLRLLHRDQHRRQHQHPGADVGRPPDHDPGPRGVHPAPVHDGAAAGVRRDAGAAAALRRAAGLRSGTAPPEGLAPLGAGGADGRGAAADGVAHLDHRGADRDPGDGAALEAAAAVDRDRCAGRARSPVSR
ncbi:hypothetical protein Scinn_44500 [Streptomyces virginiae]|uniref:Polysaccharide chain length determinant N-terminal domain-containing protein n=1 Tax=Streptomyces virginiae TaxID=1961 RepID=A0ABQ3NQI1_STRVG|nr:hypothetical protein [Streptomyces virginiae]GHI14987.1 hypothetical protein Scinn_44500 [Streptomyces virginiae]